MTWNTDYNHIVICDYYLLSAYEIINVLNIEIIIFIFNKYKNALSIVEHYYYYYYIILADHFVILTIFIFF
jgi:hypothetical protein